MHEEDAGPLSARMLGLVDLMFLPAAQLVAAL
jgi:hypothetical protein